MKHHNILKLISFIFCLSVAIILPQTAFAEGEYDIPLMQSYSGHTDKINSLCFSSDDRILASVGSDKTLRIYFKDSVKESVVKNAHEGTINKVIINSTNDMAATCSDDKTIKVWHISTGNLITTLYGHEGNVNSILFSSDGKSIYSCSNDGSVRFWDVDNSKVYFNAKFEAPVKDIAVSKDAKLLAAAVSNGTVALINLGNNSIVKIFNTVDNSGKSVNISKLEFSPDNKYIISTDNNSPQPLIYSTDDDFKLYPLLQNQLKLGEHSVWNDFTITDDGNYIIGIDKVNDCVGVFNFYTGNPIKIININATCIGISKDMRYAALGNVLDNINVYDISQLKQIKLKSMEILTENNTIVQGKISVLKLYGHYSDGTDRMIDSDDVVWDTSDREHTYIDNGILLTNKGGSITISASFNGQNYLQSYNIIGDKSNIPTFTKILKNKKDDFLALDTDGNLLYSLDGSSWKDVNPGISKINDIIYVNNLYFAVSDNGEVLSSDDKIHWNNIILINEPLKNINWDGYYYKAVSNTIIFSSIDGINWYGEKIK